MKTLTALILSLAMITTPMTDCKTIVTKIHEDDQITVLVKYDGRVKERKIHGYDFEIPVILAEEVPTEIVKGKFTNEFTDIDNKIYYQFKSNDDSVWWALTKMEIGFIPSTEKEYILLYCNNGTTTKNKDCGCLPEWECECEVYDDIFLGIFEVI